MGRLFPLFKPVFHRRFHQPRSGLALPLSFSTETVAKIISPAIHL
jgi:hypothetical protein